MFVCLCVYVGIGIGIGIYDSFTLLSGHTVTHFGLFIPFPSVAMVSLRRIDDDEERRLQDD